MNNKEKIKLLNAKIKIQAVVMKGIEKVNIRSIENKRIMRELKKERRELKKY